ncbi:MAG: peptidylprolyl isomerase [Anaerolineales bacterium]|nr:peptidylprolyl isomerase [Anaerolineales bacterium]
MSASTPKLLPVGLLRLASLLLLVALSLSACEVPLGGGPATPTAMPTPSPTPLPPTPTPIPLAATVNGEGITAAEFEAELARFQSAQTALGNNVSLEEATQRVMGDLINQLLLAQGAQAEGFGVEDAMLQNRIARLSEQAGGADKLAAWEAQHGFTDESFRLALGRQIAAAWMRDKIIATVPNTAEQVHVRQILFYNADTAQKVLDQLKSGADFNTLAAQYDPATQGELGWFPRGYLLQPQIEAAAFALQPGQTSDVIQTTLGYHILMLLERDPNRMLSPDARLTLQNQALENWLQEQRAKSTITLAP